MNTAGVQAYIIPSTDEHQNEYVPGCWRRLEWISGFTGSAGPVVITTESAGLWTDGRYHLQAEQELNTSIYTLFPIGKSDVKEVVDWLSEDLPKGAIIGADPKLLSIEGARTLAEKLDPRGKTIRYLEGNLVDQIWEDRPLRFDDCIQVLPERFSGESVSSKLARVREEMQRREVDAHAVSALDCIAWLFNLRGTDVPFNPVFIAHAMVTLQDARLFVASTKVTDEVREALDGLVEFSPYNDFGDYLDNLSQSGLKVWLDPKGASHWVHEKIGRGGKPFLKESPIVKYKALKNHVEQEGMRQCHIRDGVAVVRFIRWLLDAVSKGDVTEVKAARKLNELRGEMAHFRGPSFETIAGYKDHGAIIHYRPSEATDVELKAEGMLLVDSGGQYTDGTTDITRTIALGTVSAEMRERFTRVLKGHIQLANVGFPKGTSGKQVEILARKALWEVGLDYRHGTGHGIGAYLNVHEGPQSISPRDPGVALEPGMVISNEPGYYKDSEYGIRTENVIMVREDEAVKSEYGPFYRFEVLTLVPIDRTLTDASLLEAEERAWLNAYHARVHDEISPFLNEEDRRWLHDATRPV
jgi:Xaa-Pro aminopeptidase